MDLNKVVINFTRKDVLTKSYENTYIAFLENILSDNFIDQYKVEISHDQYKLLTTITIIFEKIEDATFFKLKYSEFT